MNLKAFASALVMAVSVGGVLAILTGERRAVSLRIWLAACAVWFAVATLRRMFEYVPLMHVQFRPVLTRRRTSAAESSRRIRDVRALEGLLLRSRDNERAFRQQLQPRLIDLAQHFLRLHHGVDCEREPHKAAALLHDDYWLIDPSVEDRVPTLDDVDRFMGRLIEPTAQR